MCDKIKELDLVLSICTGFEHLVYLVNKKKYYCSTKNEGSVKALGVQYLMVGLWTQNHIKGFKYFRSKFYRTQLMLHSMHTIGTCTVYLDTQDTAIQLVK